MPWPFSSKTNPATPPEQASASGVQPEALASSSPPAATPSTPDLVSSPPLPETSSVADSATSSLLSIPDVTHIPILPLQYGDLADLGLASGWTPAGWIRWSMEVINVSTGLPWYITIPLGVCLWRLILVPLTVKSMEMNHKIRSIEKPITEIRAQIEQASAEKDMLRVQVLSQSMREMYVNAGVKFKWLILGILQVPINIGIFVGVQKLCSFPVVQLTTGGLAWIPDLTMADPYYILPIVAGIVTNRTLVATVKAGDMDLESTTAPGTKYYVKIFLLLSLLTPVLMSPLRAGTLLAVITSALWSWLQSVILRRPAIRARLGILPNRREYKLTDLPTITQSFRYALDSIAGKEPWKKL